MVNRFDKKSLKKITGQIYYFVKFSNQLLHALGFSLVICHCVHKKNLIEKKKLNGHKKRAQLIIFQTTLNKLL